MTQRLQMISVTDPNIHNIALDGNFDDCQVRAASTRDFHPPLTTESPTTPYCPMPSTSLDVTICVNRSVCEADAACTPTPAAHPALPRDLVT